MGYDFPTPGHEGLISVLKCGLYRTGSLWAHSPFGPDCRPDIITMAKPLANGYPIGAVMMRGEIAQAMSVGELGNLLTSPSSHTCGFVISGSHGTTFGGSPLACAVGHHVLQRLSDKAFLESAQENSTYLRERLIQMTKWFPTTIQREIRGRGLILGIGFQDESVPSQVMSLARERGVLILTAGKDAVRLVPSLNVGKEEVDLAVDVLESCLAVVESLK